MAAVPAQGGARLRDASRPRVRRLRLGSLAVAANEHSCLSPPRADLVHAKWLEQLRVVSQRELALREERSKPREDGDEAGADEASAGGTEGDQEVRVVVEGEELQDVKVSGVTGACKQQR